MDEDQIIDITGIVLSPGHPDECNGNGKHPDMECCCDECDYLMDCYPCTDE